MRQYSEWETMKRVWDVEEIKDLMSRRAVYSANEERERELKELWVNQPDHMATASFGRNYGYYVGMDAIRSYYVDSHQTRIDALPGTGYMECHRDVPLCGTGRGWEFCSWALVLHWAGNLSWTGRCSPGALGQR